ncbi:hypothetical protein ACFC5Z_05930 [Streptomyces sp. NPDC056004]|uniref:hypothetical protein n=1 Tax=unclassified Streptomyces TaxID=2593676 RepID=UPI0035DD9849
MRTYVLWLRPWGGPELAPVSASRIPWPQSTGTQLVLIEPFLLPINGVIEAGAALIGEEERRQWRTDLDPKIQAVRQPARAYDAHLLAADGMFAELAATNGPEYWAADGVHPTPAGHAALAAAWLRLVT